MTSPTQRRHDELIAMLRELGNLLDDRLPEPPTYTIETRTCRKAEPVDVTDDLKHENEGLSWRWAECADERDAAVARAEKAEADVERLTRERDEAVRGADAHANAARHWRQCYDAAEYQTEQAVRRYEALRADVGTDMDACADKHTRQHMREILARDDERGRDA